MGRVKIEDDDEEEEEEALGSLRDGVEGLGFGIGLGKRRLGFDERSV